MSEYWVSHKKYFCKYCNIYIADDAPSRRQHESGLRHTGNVERFVRGLYKAGEKRKQDQEEEKREIRAITLSQLLDNVVILEESIKELVAIVHARKSLGIDAKITFIVVGKVSL